MFGERDYRLPLSSEESSTDELDADSLQNESVSSLSPSFFYPASEEDIRWKPPPNILSSLNSGLFHELDIDPEGWDEKFALYPPPPPLRDMPGPSTPMTISLSASSSDVSSSITGLSLSIPESSRCTDLTDLNESRLLSPSSDKSAPAKHLSTTSSAASTSCSSGRAPPQSSRWSEDSVVDRRSVISKIVEAPPNPRQHKLLDVIYTEMHAARFVTLAPISLIEDRIRSHFKGTCYLLRFSCLDALLIDSLSIKMSARAHL